MRHTIASKSMTLSEGALALVFAATAFLTFFIATMAQTPEYAFHASLFAAGSAAAVFAIVIVMMVLFVRDRVRYDVVAMLALFASVLVGIVPADQAFTGFSDDVVVIVASALLVSGAVARSGIVASVRGAGETSTSP